MVEAVTVYRCPTCKRKHESEKEALACQVRCGRIKEFKKRWPEVKDRGCDFANGAGWVPRTKEWYDLYMDDLMTLIRENHPSVPKRYLNHTLNYALGRTLDDGDLDEYGLFGRLMAVCQTCFREWGQPYFANNCTHDGGTKQWETKIERPEWREEKRCEKKPKR